MRCSENINFKGQTKKCGLKCKFLYCNEHWKNHLPKWYINSNTNPPTYRLEKFYMWSSIILSISASILAYITLTQSIKVQGLEEVVKTFNAKLKITQKVYIIKHDSLMVNAALKNFGVRSATDIHATLYYYPKDGIGQVIHNDPETDIEPTESLIWSPIITKNSDTATFAHSMILYKIVYTDIGTQKRDSTTVYSTCCFSIRNDSAIFRAAYKSEIDFMNTTLSDTALLH